MHRIVGDHSYLAARMLKLNYKSFGQGAPIVILHGLFGTLDNWQTIAKQLSEEYLVYILDQRNHGRSPHTGQTDYQLMAEDLRDFMEANWIYSAHIIGHSMGGKTAMQFALDYPDMVEKLIVVDIGPKAYAGGHEAIFEAMMNLDLANIGSRKEADQKLAGKITDPTVRQFLLKNLTRNKEGSYRWKMNLPVLHESYPEILAALPTENTFDKPSLFMKGEQSGYIKHEDEGLIKELFLNSGIVTISGAGHWIHAEAPQAFLEEVKKFLM